MAFTLTFLGTDTQFPGWDVHLMSELPKSPAQYKNSYIFIKKNDTQELYYVKPDGEYEKAKIIDLNSFEEKINAIKNKSKDKTKLHLIDEQIKEIVTSNGGHTPALEGYDKAETLSYISTLIPGESSESLPTDGVTQYRNSKVAVVDGPTTLGPEVGDRIARGVQAILEAISRGETEINIIAHSRGAVEAILVAHELERIQTLLKKRPIDRAELTKSVCTYTTSAMNGAHRKAFDELDLDKIAPNIDKIKLSMLTIDPVPGGNYMGITRASSLAWRDPRFYRVPKIVKEYEQYIYENERTRCFKCIVPKCDSPETTSFKLCSLPGHHGTGSGNLKSQQREDVPKGKTAEHVQELAIVKIIDFLTRNGVTITPRTKNDPFDALIAQLMPVNKEKLNKLYLDLYTSIMANREAYQYFNKTSYPTLGQEQALLKKIWTVVDERIVHYKAHNDTYLNTIVPPVPGGHFLNYEHARIHLNKVLGLSDKLSLSETINNSRDKLLKICERAEKSKIQKLQPELSSDLTASLLVADKIATTLDSQEGFALLLEGLGMLIEEVRRPYLQDEFIDLEQRGEIYKAVNKAFSLFNEFASTHAENEVAKTILKNLNSNLATTLKVKHDSLVNQYQGLSIKLEGSAFFARLQEEIKKISRDLAHNGAHEKDYKVMIQLNSFLDQAKELDTSKPDEIRKFIQQHITSLNENEEFQDVESELAINSLILAKLLMTEAIDDSLNYDVDSLIKEVIKSTNQLEKFREALPNFKILYDDMPYDQWDLELKEKRHHLVHLAAQYIVKKGLELDQQSIKELFIENEALYKEISGLATGLGAKNHLIFDLTEVKKLNQQFSVQVQKLEEKANKLTQEQEQLTKYLSTMEEAHEFTVRKLTQQHDSVTKELVQARMEHDLAVQKLSEVNKVEKQEFAQKAGDLKKQLDELTEVRENLAKKLSQGEREHGIQVDELIQEKESLSEQLKMLQKEHIHVVQELTTANKSQKQEFSEKVAGLEKQLNELTKGQESLTKQLAQKEKEHVKAIEELTFTQEKQRKDFSTQMDVLNEQLVKLNQEQEQLTKKLSTTEKAHELKVQQLTEQHDRVSEELAQTKKDHELAVRKLSEVNEVEKQEFAQKEGDLKKQLDELTEVREGLAKKLSQGESEHEIQVDKLIQEKESLSEQLKMLQKEHIHVVQELTTANKSQKQEFSEKVAGLEKQLNELTKGQESLTKQLAQKEKEHVKAIEELIFTQEKQRKDFSTQMDVLNEQLVKLNQEQEQLTKKLSTTEKAHELKVQQLTEQHDRVSEELAQTKKDHELAVRKLSEVNEVEKQEFAQKEGDLKKQLDELTEVREGLAKKLSQGESEHEIQVDKLIQEKESLSEQLKMLQKEHIHVVQELTTANKSQKQEFSEKVAGLEKQLNELTKGQESLTEQLAQKGKEHLKDVENLVLAEKQREELTNRIGDMGVQLVNLTERQKQLTEQLSTGNREHTFKVKELTQENDTLSGQLRMLNEKHALFMQNLSTPNEVREQEFAEEVDALQKQLAELIKVQESLTEQLNSNEKEHQRAIKKLTQENKSLELVNTYLQDDVELLKQQKKNLQGILGNSNEWKCQSIIIDKLTPLTKDYLLHLAAEIQKSIAPELDADDLSGFITQVKRIQVWPQDKASKILKEKFDAVSGLYMTLHDETILKPSEKITKFYGQLNDANEVLKKHRDPNWQNFANAAVVLGIVLTGVLPGLTVLGVMALCGKSPKFWESAGHTFFTTSSEEIAEKIPDTIMKNGITSGGS
ncbi:hypothetical protein TUM19329_12010 [Legionella antarctica]|uniref:Uncharacterized protein n=1 Tax=Legionella antarctica TaxID=2708020 RepID=A0A6F8T3V8_9GAMM|nr:hypothetical protein [Legionella antarctica]BCA94840.1 hypothetical protein TUM19329_12010 [Legionella antarctica]